MISRRRVSYELTLTAVLGLAFGIVFFDRNALNFLMPFILADIPLNNAQIGMVASGLALTWAISGMVVGQIADRIGSRKPFLIAAVVVFSLSSFVTGLATNFFMLLGARLLMGLAEGPVLPIAQSLMAQASSPERRGLTMGIMQNVLSNLMGSLVAPLVLVAVASSLGWRAAFYFTALPGLTAAVLLWYFVKEPPRSPVRTDASPGTDGFLAVLKIPNIRICVALSCLMVGWMITGWVFLPIYFTSTLGFTPRQMAILMSILGLTGAVAGLVIPALSDRFGRRAILAAGCALGIVTPVAALYGGGSAAMLTLFVSTGWMAGGTFSIFMATVPAESASAGQITTAMALIMGTGELFGGAVTPTLVGWLTDRFGANTPLLAEIICAAAAAILALGLEETAPLRTGENARAAAKKTSEPG